MNPPRLVQLDFLRAICVFLVLGRHLIICPPETNYFLYQLTKFWNYGGWVGVDIFFVLSGFLVSGILFREYQKKGNLELKRFLIRRGLKIYPSFYLMIAVTVLLSPLFAKEIPLKTLLAEIFFVQNTIFGRLWEHTWSLAVEEHFYFGLAILSYFLLRLNRNKGNAFALIPYIFIFFAVTCFALRLLMAIYKGTNISPTPFRIDSLFFGVLISYFWHFRGLGDSDFLKKYKTWLIILGSLMLLPMFFFMSVINPWAFVLGFTTNYIAAGCLLLGFLKTDFAENPVVKILSYIGTFSYSIYLWHLPVMYWIALPSNRITEIQSWFLYAGCYLLGSIVFGILLSKIVEYPILKIRDKYFPPISQPL